MKDLTIEQKAKRYDEALEIAKKNYITAQDLCNGSQIGVECFKNTLENIFPEFKESEDERIRKSCIHFLELQKHHHDATFEIEECIAWLEKQGEYTLSSSNEQKPTWSEEDEIGLSDALWAIEQATTIAKDENDMGTLWYAERWLATIKDRIQSKQSNKPQDKTEVELIKEETVDNAKVESNFKVGDWVVRTNGESFCNGSRFAKIQSIELDEEMYYLDTGSWLYLSEIRLWSIKDAKDGDILVSLSKMHPFIFNGHYDEDTDYVYAYCGISDIIKDDSFYFDKYPDEEFKVWDSVENVRPATRDQRNLLFSKMKDSGYEWDSKKKELIKTEQVLQK